MPKLTDTRVVYGAGCTWWDSIDKVAKTSSGLPSCPFCGGVLFEMAGEDLWWQGVDEYATAEPGYREFIEWLRGRCLPTIPHAKQEWQASL